MCPQPLLAIFYQIKHGMINVFTSSAGNQTSGNCGWSFVAVHDVNMTGVIVMQYSGCTGATQHTAAAMAILQALYWLREQKHQDYVIYTSSPAVCYSSILAQQIEAMHPKQGSIVKLDHDGEFVVMADILAISTLRKIAEQPDLTYSDVETGQHIIKKEALWTQSYIVMLKSLATRTVTLRNMTTVSKKLETFNQNEFDNGKFILL